MGESGRQSLGVCAMSEMMVSRTASAEIVGAPSGSSAPPIPRPKGSPGGTSSEIALVPQKAVDQIAATAMPLVVHDVANNPLFAGSKVADYPEHSKVSFIGVPVKANQRVIGSISIDRVWDGHANFRFDEDVRFLAMVANLVGQTIRMFGMIAEDRDRLISEQHRLQKTVSNDRGKAGAAEDAGNSGVVGSSQAVQRVLKMAKTAAKS